MNNIAFKDSEIRMETDLETGALRVLIPVATVRERLAAADGAAPRPAAKPELTRGQVLDRFDQTLTEIGWQRWLDMNERQTKSGKRSPGKLEQIREELDALAGRYGRAQLGVAMARCKAPRHASVAYVKAILKNENGRGNHGSNISGRHDDFSEQLDAALQNV